MSITAGLVPEFKQEMAGLRKILALSPADQKFDWKPHPKSMGLGRLTGHLAELPGWGSFTLQATELDLAADPTRKALGTEPIDQVTVLRVFDKNVADAITAMVSTDDNAWMVPWTLRHGKHVIFTLPRLAVMRVSVINHIVHHRAQLGVYLRMLDIPLPQIYGPTADNPG